MAQNVKMLRNAFKLSLAKKTKKTPRYVVKFIEKNVVQNINIGKGYSSIKLALYQKQKSADKSKTVISASKFLNYMKNKHFCLVVVGLHHIYLILSGEKHLAPSMFFIRGQ